MAFLICDGYFKMLTSGALAKRIMSMSDMVVLVSSGVQRSVDARATA